MKRWIQYGVAEVIVFYMALLYESRSFLVLGISGLFFFLYAVIYRFLLWGKISVSMTAPCFVEKRTEGIIVNIKVYNRSFLPINRLRLCIKEEYSYEGKKQKKYINVSTGSFWGRKQRKKGVTAIQIRLSPRYTGLDRITIRSVTVFEWLGILNFPVLQQKGRNVSEVLVLSEKYDIPMLVENTDDKEDRAFSTMSFWKNDIGEITDVREYQPGDKLHAVHWKLSAKTDELMVHERKEEGKMPFFLFIMMSEKESPKRIQKGKKKQQRKQKECLLSLIRSYCAALLVNDCIHYVVWFDAKEQKVQRMLIDTEEKIIQLLASLEGFWHKRDDSTLVEEYKALYPDIAVQKKLLLYDTLTVKLENGTVLRYNMEEMEKSVHEQKVILG